MPLKLRLDELSADLISVKNLLSTAERVGDPVGKLQYEYRRNQIEEEIKKLSETKECKASIALFFNGEPVIGSKGIHADFAGRALEHFQEIVTKSFAHTEVGSLGARGPVPHRPNTKLMITEITRGSFGFVLDELDEQQDICDTALRTIVDEVAVLLQRTGAIDDGEFEQATEGLDQRTLGALKDFFFTLDSYNATLRVVEDKHDYLLDRNAVNRGRIRTEATLIEEESDIIEGELLGFLPTHKRFEFKLKSGEEISGSASKEAADQYLAYSHSPEGAAGKIWKTKMNVRTIKRRNRPPKLAYTIQEFLGLL